MRVRRGTAGHRGLRAAGAAAAAAAAVAACGSATTVGVNTGDFKGSPSASPRPTSLGSGAGGGMPTTGTPAKLAIEEDWLTVFSPTTATPLRMLMLENGQQFGQALRAQAGSGAAAQVQVSGVSLTSPSRATVTYRLTAGKMGQGTRTGTAVYQHGVWKVSASSFCGVLAAAADGGKAGLPAACHGR